MVKKIIVTLVLLGTLFIAGCPPHRQVLFIHIDIIITAGEGSYIVKIIRTDGNDSDPGAHAEI